MYIDFHRDWPLLRAPPNLCNIFFVGTGFLLHRGALNRGQSRWKSIYMGINLNAVQKFSAYHLIWFAWNSRTVRYESNGCYLLEVKAWLFLFSISSLVKISTHFTKSYPQDMLVSLSTLLRGTTYEKLRWTFTLYDLNKDGYITKQEVLNVVIAVHELMGIHGSPPVSFAQNIA